MKFLTFTEVDDSDSFDGESGIVDENEEAYHLQLDACFGEDYQHLDALFRQVGDSAAENSRFFSVAQKPIHHDFYKSFVTILNVLDPLQISLEAMTSACPKFDLSPTCKGNGYRSIISIIESCLQQILAISDQIHHSREKFFFRSYHVFMDLESHANVLSRLLTIVHLALVLIDSSKVGCLFPEADIANEVMDDFESVNRECFYGRSFGFQYVDSLRKPLNVVQTAMAAYGDGFIRHNNSFSRALSSMLHSGKYMVDPELRAKRIIQLTQNASMDFCKAFWGLTEEYGVQHVPLLMCPAMSVNHEFVIPPTLIQMETLTGKGLAVELPLIHASQKGVLARILSYMWREGQNRDATDRASSGSYTPLGQRPRRKSRYLIFHCHGGGFVAQSSKSHEIYLRYWAKELRIPILSIDYSLAPDAPFPQALNEAFFAYCWALQNLDKLGTTGEQICFCGDSAGANLVTAVVLKAIQANVRVPDSLVLAYPPFNVQYIPSPSRLLSLMDPLLPIGILKACLAAYAGSSAPEEKNEGKGIKTARFNEAFNPYDIDLGTSDSRWARHKLDMSHSLSDSNLPLMKTHIKEVTSEDTDSESYYSDFPYSTSSSSILTKEEDIISLSDSLDEFYSGIEFTVKRDRTSQTSEINKELIKQLKHSTQSSQRSKNAVGNTAESSQSTNNGENISRIRRISSISYSALQSLTSTVTSATGGVASYLLGPTSNAQDGTAGTDSQGNASTNDVSRSNTISPVDSGDIVTPTEDRCAAADFQSAIHRERDSRVSLTELHELEQQELMGDVRHHSESIMSLELEELQATSPVEEDAFFPNSTGAQQPIDSDVPDSSTQASSSDVDHFKICSECLNDMRFCECLSYSHQLEARHRRRRRRHSYHRHHRHHDERDSTDRKIDDNDDSYLNRNRRHSEESICDKSPKRKVLSRAMTCPAFGSSREHLSPDAPVLYDSATDSVSIQMMADSVATSDQDSGLPEEHLDVSQEEILMDAGKDPLMSPLLASDALLRKMPQISIVACSLDPLFDDSVEFVRKLQKLDRKAELYVLDKLPHGFLNMQVLSSEAREGCDLMIACIKKAMDMGMRRNDSTSVFSSVSSNYPKN